MESKSVEIQSFIENLAAKFDSPFPGGFKPGSKFRDHPEWSSLQALVIVVGVEEDYGVMISADELRESNTVEDLFHIVSGKLSA
jgi:acyl carrier protein